MRENSCGGLRSACAAAFLGLALLAMVSGARAVGPLYWDWPAGRSFGEIELDGATVDRDGHLVAGLTARVLGPEGPEVAWCAVPDGRGGYFTGTGHGGEIHHVAAGGESRLVVTLETAEVFSLLRLADGDLLAGCGPDGHVYRVDPAGTADLVGTVSGGYAWALAQGAADETVWIAAGSPAGLWAYEPRDGAFGLVAELGAANALDVAVQADGDVLVATQGPGLVIRHRPGRTSEVVCETAQDEVRQFVTGPGGDVFVLALAGGAGDGGPPDAGAGLPPAPPPALLALLGNGGEEEVAAAALYRLGDEGGAELWWSGRDDLLSVAWSPHWGWLAGGPLADDASQASLQRLTPPSGAQPVAHWPGGDVLQILVDPEGGRPLAVTQAHLGAVVALGDNGDQPRQALSPPLDGGQPVSWGRLEWRGEVPRGRLKWSVRGGNRAQPDASWTSWSDSWSDTARDLDLPRCRFLQWRVVFPAGETGAEARVTSVAVSAWQENRRPVIADFRLEHLQELQAGGLMTGSDNVTHRFRSGLQAEFNRNAAAQPWPGPRRDTPGRGVRVFTWQGSDPNGDRLAYRLDYRPRGGGSWRAVPTGRPGRRETAETLVAWDVSGLPDGVYEVRLTASDHPDNPAGLALSDERVFGPVTVDNTAPVLADVAVTAVAGGFRVTGRADDGSWTLAGARLVLPDGGLERLDPRDRICDSSREEFAAEVIWPRPGRDPGPTPWRVRVEVRDLAGNWTAVEEEVR